MRSAQLRSREEEEWPENSLHIEALAHIIAFFKCLELCLWGEQDQALLLPEQGLMEDSSSPPETLSNLVSCSDMVGD